jgi:putative ABC transport system permease protein
MAMSIRERTREVAVLKTLGFTRQSVLGLFVSEAVALAAIGGFIGIALAYGLVFGISKSPYLTFYNMKVTVGMWAIALGVSGMVGLVSSLFPSYHASQVNIVDGLRHIG